MRCPAGANRQGGAGESICEFARAARDLAEQVRAGCRETVRGRGYKATGDGGAWRAYVRGTMYDVQHARRPR